MFAKGGLAADQQRLLSGSLAGAFEATIRRSERRWDGIAQLPSGIREPDALVEAIKRLYAKIGFDAFDVTRDRDRGHAKLGSGILEAFVARSGLERSKGMKG